MLESALIPINGHCNENARRCQQYLGEHDTATRRLIERILSVEQEHAEGLASMRESMRCQGGAAAVANHRSRPMAALR